MRLSRLGYQRWQGQSTGIWTRRFVIMQSGIRLCLQSRILKVLIALAWGVSLVMVPLYFTLGQLLSPESGLMGYLAEFFGERFTRLAAGLMSWLLLYPEVCVNGVYRFSFFATMNAHLFLSFLAVSLFVPKLIAHDLSSQAIIIYNSKALTRLDYMVGKFGIVFGILGFMWIVPTTLAWFLGNLLSPDWTFFVHSFSAFGIALLVGVVGVAAISFLALAISALAKRTSTATTMWVFLWIISGVVSGIVGLVYSGGKYISISRSISDLGMELFDLPSIVEDAQAMLPFFSLWLPQSATQGMREISVFQGGVSAPLIAIGIFSAVSLLIISKRVKTQ